MVVRDMRQTRAHCASLLVTSYLRQRREVVPKCYNHPTQVRRTAGAGSSELAGTEALSMKLMCVL